MYDSDVQRLVECAFRSGRDAGYKQALKDFQAEIDARIQTTDSKANGPVLDELVAIAPSAPSLPPYLQRTLAHLRAHPGVTARQTIASLGGSKTALYRLAARGLARKDGSRFYAQ